MFSKYYFGINLLQAMDPSPSIDRADAQWALRIAQFFIALPFILSAFLTTLYLRVPFLKSHKLSCTPKLTWVVLCIVIYIVSQSFLETLLSWNSSFEFGEKMQNVLSSLEELNTNALAALLYRDSGWHFAINLFIMAVVPAISEEIFFRGILLRSFSGVFNNIHAGIFASSFIFAAIHMQPFKFIPMMVMGIGLAYAFYLTQNLWVPIFLHLLNNAMATIMKYYESRNALPEIISSLETSGWLLAIFSLFLTLSAYFLLGKLSKKRLKVFIQY